jgi:hypothetical protein
MPVRFDDLLHLSTAGVVAEGPVDPGETVVEMCAWVFQRGENDAAATEMTTTGGKLVLSPGRWKLPLAKVGQFDVVPGQAFAVAVALMKDADGKQRVVWWGHPVDLEASRT